MSRDFRTVVLRPPSPAMMAAHLAAQAWWIRHGLTPGHVAPVGWNMAAARNEAVREFSTPNQPLVIVDPDVHPQNLSAILSTVDACYREPHLIHQPYTDLQVRSIGSATPKQRITPWRGSGILVTMPETWNHVGGQDERFTTWGPEHEALQIAHQRLAHRPLPALQASLVAYTHPHSSMRLHADYGHPLLDEYRAADTSRKMRWVVKRAQATVTMQEQPPNGGTS